MGFPLYEQFGSFRRLKCMENYIMVLFLNTWFSKTSRTLNRFDNLPELDKVHYLINSSHLGDYSFIAKRLNYVAMIRKSQRIFSFHLLRFYFVAVVVVVVANRHIYVPNQDTVRCRYNAVIFLPDPNKIRLIALFLGRGVGCILRVQTLIYTLHQWLQWCM